MNYGFTTILPFEIFDFYYIFCCSNICHILLLVFLPSFTSYTCWAFGSFLHFVSPFQLGRKMVRRWVTARKSVAGPRPVVRFEMPVEVEVSC